MAWRSQNSGFARMVDAMSQPSVYANANADGGIAVRQTHMSTVFLLDHVVYKVKKPVKYGFVDYSTLEARKSMCENEVRLNKRLAPAVYLCVSKIYLNSQSDSFSVEPLKVSPAMLLVEYAVKMVRLSDHDTLLHTVRNHSIRAPDLQPIVSRIAEFHDEIAARSPEISRFASYDAFSYNVVENFTQTSGHVGAGLIEAEVYDDVESRQLKRIDDLRLLIDQRAASDCPCDSHGDLRLEHIYRSGEDVHIIDCVEFNDRFRYEDPLCDVAFLYMDLFYETCGFQLPNALLNYYMKASRLKSSPGVQVRRIQRLQLLQPKSVCAAHTGLIGFQALAMFYASYRSVVRAKVAGITAMDSLDCPGECESAKSRTRKHWVVARQLVLPASSRIGMVLISGLPGSGKSTIARFLTAKFAPDRCLILRTDAVRKESAKEPVYTDSGKAEVYTQVLERVQHGLRAGRVVLVDATFNLVGQVERFRQVALRDGFIFAILLCQCRNNAETLRRLTSRRADASDADWSVYEQMARSWAGPTESTPSVELVDTTASLESTYANATRSLRRIGLCDLDQQEASY